MNDTTLTYEILDDLVQGWFNDFYQDNGADGVVDLDEMVTSIRAELHPATVAEIKLLTGLSIRGVLMSHLDIHAGETI